MRKYAIPFRGLKEGKHRYEFVADNSFFEQFDSSEIEKGLVTIRVELTKHAQFLELHFNLAGKVTVTCDRCLDSFLLPIEHQAVLYVRFGEKTYEQSEEVLVLADSVNEVRLDQYIFEYIHLALPYQRIHPETGGHSGCNPEMIEKLRAHTAKDESGEKDPRWDKLRTLTKK